MAEVFAIDCPRERRVNLICEVREDAVVAALVVSLGEPDASIVTSPSPRSTAVV